MAYEILEGRICFTNLVRFEHTEPFCPQGDVVTAHPEESHQQGVKTQLRRRSKLKKPKCYTPSTSPELDSVKPPSLVKKRKLAESITKESEKEEATPQRYKRLCTPTEGADDTSAINLVVEDTEEEQLKEYHFKVTPKMVEERIKAMKDHLLEIASVPPSEDTPLPHLERHQAWLLLGGYQKHYKNLETYDLGANTFSYYIFPDGMRQLENLFQAKPKPRKGFVPLMACMDTFLKYDLLEYIPDQCYYVRS